MVVPPIILRMCGIFLIVGGLVGLLLPMIPGMLLIISGSALLGGGFLNHLSSR